MTYEEWEEHCLVDLERGSEIKLKASEEEIFFERDLSGRGWYD